MTTSTFSSLAFLFPGQGSQAVGMGKELTEKYPVARQTFEEADGALGMSLSRLCFAGPEEELRRTENTQPAILTVSVATWRVLAEQGVEPAWVAGHSLGEYSAHVAAGTLSFADAVRTVRKRGRYMQEAVPAGVGAMAAIIGMEAEKARQICVQAAQGEVCNPANMNSPEQVVISGHKAAIERAVALATEQGAKKAVLLPVSAPFHCSLMRPAQESLARELQALQMLNPTTPVMCNVDAALVKTADASRDALIRQVTGAVLWEECVRGLIAKGVETFVEVGPGKVLWGLMRQIDRTKTSWQTSDDAALQKALQGLRELTP
jgi:[acyl-carrier-protein] S-malonyltransferase